MNERRPETSLRFAAGAACAFTLVALIEIVPVLVRHEQSWSRISGIGFALVAVLWWIVFFQWKRRLGR